MKIDIDDIYGRAETLYHELQMDNLPRELKRNSIDYYYLSVYPAIGSLKTYTGKTLEYPEQIKNIYIHIPFCSGSCRFCSYVFKPIDSEQDIYLIENYYELLKKELLLHARNTSISLSYLYFGGGTPSLTPPEVFEDFLDFLDENEFMEHENIFATIELHPEIFQKGAQLDELLRISRKYKINRFSIGYQSHESSLLKYYTRRHDPEFLSNAVARLKSDGIEYINIDTMYGLPHQSIESWMMTLESVLNMNPESISCYFLFVDKHTKLHNDILHGKVHLPTHKHIQIQHLISQILLESNGYIEIPNDYYWKNLQHTREMDFVPRLPSKAHTLALGAGSYGYMKSSQYCNYFAIERYRHSLENGFLPIWKSTKLNQDGSYIRDIMFSLKNESHLNACLFRETYGQFMTETHPDLVRLLLEKGLLERFDDNLRLSRKGRLCVEEIATAFVESGSEHNFTSVVSKADRILNEKHNYFPTYWNIT